MRLSLPVGKALEDVKGWADAHDAAIVIAHASGAVRLSNAQSLSSTLDVFGRAFRLAILVRPQAFISPHADIEEELIASFGSLIGADSQVGRHTMIRAHAVIGHDNMSESGVTRSHGVTIAGGVCTGYLTTVGM